MKSKISIERLRSRTRGLEAQRDRRGLHLFKERWAEPGTSQKMNGEFQMTMCSEAENANAHRHL